MTGIPVLDIGASPAEVVDAVRRAGVAQMPGFLTNVEEVKEEALATLHARGANYEFGRVLRPKARQCPKIRALFSSEWMREICDAYLGENEFNSGIVITHDFRNDQGLALNGYLHFDRAHTFKFLIYLTDCDKDSGAFSCIPNSHVEGKNLRDGYAYLPYRDIPNKISEQHIRMGHTEETAIPIEAPAGTLIVFDTDLFHFGGRVEAGRERLVIRAHIGAIK